MKVLNVIIFAEGGKRLFVHDYDSKIYQHFAIDHLVGFFETFHQLFNVAIVQQQMGMVLFENVMLVFDYFQKTTEGYGTIKFTTVVVSEIDRTVPFDPQEIVLRRVAEQISIDFYSKYQEELYEVFRTWLGAINKFQGFKRHLNTIVLNKAVITAEVIEDLKNILAQIQ
jgi:hypothetical protein